MFIQTETTPNPATLKFLPGRSVLPQDFAAGSAAFTDAETAKVSPLAVRLFAVDGVEGVFLGSDFVTVTKMADQDWSALKPALLGAIMEHFMAGLPVINAGAAESGSAETFGRMRVLARRRVVAGAAANAAGRNGRTPQAPCGGHPWTRPVPAR